MRNVARKINVVVFVMILLFGMLSLTSIVHIFPSAVRASPDWLSGWNCRRQLTVNGTLISEALTDFPVMVKLDSSFFDFDKAKSGGEDVRFTDSDGTTLLKYEIEKWNSTNKEGYLWVKLPLVANGTITTFYMYYGNSTASDAQDKANVWNSNFKMVQHLKEASGTHADSTSNGNNGSPYNGVIQGTTGKIDGADTFDGSNDYVDCGNGSSLTQTEFTIEAWIKRNGNGVVTSTGTGGMTSAEPLVAKGRGYSETIGLNVNYFLGINQGNKTFGFDFEDNINGLNHPISGTTIVIDGQWYYVVATHNGTSALYVNGALETSNLTARTPDYNPWSVSLSTAISGAGAGTPAGYFNGIVDEVRVSNKTFSAAWVKASFYSGSNSMLSYGSEESIVPTYSNIGYTVAHAGTNSEFHAKWSDSAGLDTAIFSTNNTGTWQNYSIPVSGTESWANKTVMLNDTPGTVVGYRWYCNNTLGYLADTGMRTMTTTGDWQYAMKLYFNNTGISETLVDFPVFINLSRAGTDFWSHVSPTVDDLRFVNYDSATDLYFEVEYWNYSANTSYVWVKVPQIEANSTTNFIYVYYGNPSPPSSSYRDSTQVWTSNFRMVQHLKESSGIQYDSTSYDNDVTAAGSVSRTSAGFIDGADAFSGANGNYLNCGSSSSLTVTQYTIEALIKRDGNGVATNTGNGGFYGEPIVAKGRAYVETLGLNINYFLSINQTGNVIGFDFEDNVNGGNHPVFSNSTIQNGRWYYITLTYDGTANIYINGNLDRSTSIGFAPDYNPWATTIGSAIGGAGSGTADGSFNGTIDEVRISNVARSPEWVTAQNLSMNDQYVTFGSEQAPNTAPDEPFDPSPSDGAIKIPISTELSVNVSDPDGDAMDVYFYQPEGEVSPPENFTVVVLPDTQIYSSTYPSVFTNQTQWIVDNQTTNNIKFVTHEGDIVNTLTTASEWQNANTSMSKLDGKLPYGFSPGNHDGAGTDTSTYSNYFGYSRYSTETWYGGAFSNDNNNSYQLFSVGYDKYLVLHLQYNPSTDVLAWANSTINNHSDRRVILTTHEFLDSSGVRTTIGNNIWNNFVSYHADQIFLVLCGHYSREARRTDTVNGHTIYQLMADYQNDANGGNGWLRLIEFHPAEDKIYIKTYSPYQKSFETDSASQFTLDYDMTYTGSSGPQLIGVANDVPSGSTATISWTGLNYSTTYQWYTVTIDSQGAPTQSETWNFTTTPPTYTLTVNRIGSGSVNLNNTGPYYYGDEVELTAVPTVGWTFEHWSADLSGSANPATILIDGDKTVNATFTQNVYTLTTFVIGSGAVDRNNSGPYYYGDTVELTAVPSTGWSFQSWSGDLTGSTSPETILIDGDKSLIATFSHSTYTLTISTEGSGSVERNNTGPYYYGDVVELTAVPTIGWTFDHWSGDLSGSSNPATILIDGSKSINANFTQNAYNLVISVDPSGSGSVNLNNTGPYHYGDTVELTAIPTVGWSFDHWSGDLIGSTNHDTIVITGDKAVTAHFTLLIVGDHDIAITNVTTSKDGCRPMLTVPDNSFVKINVTVLNRGNFTETYNVTVYANETVIETQIASMHLEGTTVVLQLTWNTTGWTRGNYTIRAYATPVPSEVNNADNTFIAGIIRIAIPGDINGDGIVDIFDAILLSGSYNSVPGRPNWSPNADLKADDVVDIYDAIVLSNHYNQHE